MEPPVSTGNAAAAHSNREAAELAAIIKEEKTIEDLPDGDAVVATNPTNFWEFFND